MSKSGAAAAVARRLFLLSTLIILGASSFALAQNPTFNVEGVVSDAQQAVLPGVTVTIHNLSTGLTRAVTSDAGGRYVFVNLPPAGSYTISAELSGKLRELSGQQGVTLFMTLLAAFQLLLSRYSRQTDIVVGTPIAGRNRLETESLIGFFVNTLVMRTDLSGDRSFVELLGRVREVCLGAYAHQEVPFEKLVEELQPDRSLSWSSLFQVMIVLNTLDEDLTLDNMELHLVEGESQTTKFDLNLLLQFLLAQQG